MRKVKIFSVVMMALCGVFASPLAAFAFGGHESLTCSGCHSIHDAKGKAIFAVAANKKDINNNTKKPFQDVTALCLGCHQSAEKGGMGIKPISSHISHPYGISNVNPKVANVPGELMKSGKFECMSCHDPHPSNPNYRYLRTDTKKGSKMGEFCAMCHPMKADPTMAAKKRQIFNSMDETKYKTVTKPKKSKKIAQN